MYIALKWLIGLSLAMWVAMCAVDIMFFKKLKDNNEGVNVAVFEYNSTKTPEKMKVVDRKESQSPLKSKEKYASGLHYIMFLAGALAVTLFNKKKDIISYTRHKIAEINIPELSSKVRDKLNKTASEASVATCKFFTVCQGQCRELSTKIKNMIIFLQSKRVQSHIRLNLILIKKLKEMGNERKNLGQLLIAAIHENKNIRLQYQLETMAKSRLERHIEATQKQIKENRSRYINFQQLYLLTHQENMFLKSRIVKLTKDKEEADNNLMSIMNEIYKSKNNELKTFCSKFIVRTKDNLLQFDVSMEIQKFLKKVELPSSSSEANWPWLEQYGLHAQPKRNIISSQPSSTSRFTEILQDGDNMLPLISDVPTLKGLPGEYVWTVKDKDGIIEKLYEYDFDSDFDNGDTIRRIREYSVYHDKECLLDFNSSKTAIQQAGDECSGIRDQYLKLIDPEYPLTSQKFLTGSKAFQKFLQSNKNIVQSTRLPTTPLPSGKEMNKLKEIDTSSVKWKLIKREGLDLAYTVPIPRAIANELFQHLEDTLEYFSGDLSQIKVFGKVYPLPRQQVAYGDPGITYTYSGVTVPALPWPAPISALRNFLTSLRGVQYDFVLVNRYRNGCDHMGEHRDNEPDLDPNYPIASISLGQERTFVLKHKDARKSGKDKKPIPPVKVELENGSVLFMNPPTNDIWYHSLPIRKKLQGARINLTFRKMRH